MAKHSSSRKKQARRLGRTARGLHVTQRNVRNLAGALQAWPAVIQGIDGQIATIVAMLDVYREELEKLGVQDLQAKFKAKADEMIAQFSASAANPKAEQQPKQT